ncbi:MAG TPA: ABC transporter substrate-binding protein [Candidatus Limnocylindria bacterium]|nr:ABC transporter substrate-binding protein [Candidatus Limnocylindria bacterium]
MIGIIGAALVLLFLAAPAAVGAQEKFIASYAGFAGFQAPLWSASDFGFLAKRGVNMDLVMIPGSARGAQALLGGSTHFAQIDGTALIAAINQGADLVFVASSLNKFPFSLVTQKNIRQPKDLAGKKIGIVSLGGAHEVSLILALREWNIPRQSVTLLASGPAANRLIALSAGALDATLLAPPETGEAARMGLPTLAHMTELKAAYFPMNAIATRRSFMEKNRDAVKRFLLAYAEGIHQFMSQKERGLALLTQRMKQKNPAVVEETYHYFAASFSSPPRMSQEGMRAAIDMLQQRSPETKFDTSVGRYVDERLLDELEREGWFKKMGGKS